MTRGLSATDKHPSGLTLVELLIAVAVLGVVVGVFLPRLETSIPDQLASAARVLASDLEYTRELAVANSSTYRVSFAPAANQYELTHRGPNPAFDDLPPSAFLADTTSNDGKPAQVFSFDDLPHGGAGVRLHAVLRSGNLLNPPILEFDSLGETGASSPTEIWLRAGSGESTRYQRLTVSPVTGIARIDELTAVAPTF